MNDSGEIVGYSSYEGLFNDDGTYSGTTAIRLRNERLSIYWPSTPNPSMEVLNIGTSDALLRARKWNQTDFGSERFIDDAGGIYAKTVSIRKNLTVSPYSETLSDKDLVYWTNRASDFQKITDNSAAPPLETTLYAISPNGKKIFQKRVQTNSELEYTAEGRTFTAGFSPQYSGFHPRSINNNGRFIGFDYTQDKIAWGTAEEGLNYILIVAKVLA